MGDEQIPWDPASAIDPAAVSGFDAVIHLAGESIVGRWTAEKKARIRNSRVTGTKNLSEALAKADPKPAPKAQAAAKPQPAAVKPLSRLEQLRLEKKGAQKP